MQRRLYDGGATYTHTAHVLWLHKVISFSAWGLALAQIPFIINFFWSKRRGAPAPANAWDATTIEWAAPSPPPHGNFEVQPVAYRGPYEYSVPGHAGDFFPQSEPGPETVSAIPGTPHPAHA
jgi:cytochrome c oxidase subunit 1